MATVLHQLLQWDRPPVAYSGLRAIQPVFLLDWGIHSHNKKGIELLYGDEIGPLIDGASEEQLDQLITAISAVLNTIDAYLRVRGTESGLLRKIRAQRCSISDALEAIKRGYAPGHVPSAADRTALANQRLREVSHG